MTPNPLSAIQLLIVLAIIGIGFAWYIYYAKNTPDESTSLSSFFAGGERLGSTGTQHTNWGLSFALANGVWFYILLAYQFGWKVGFLHIIWAISTLLVAYFFPHIQAATQGRTIHGYLSLKFGRRTQLVAAVVTLIGYFLNSGFELFWSGKIFAASMGYSDLDLPIALIMAVACGAYCMIGGYAANSRTDRPQNYLGATGLVILCSAAILAVRSGTATQLFETTPLPTELLIGFAVFLLLFNLVDMANWEIVGARPLVVSCGN